MALVNTRAEATTNPSVTGFFVPVCCCRRRAAAAVSSRALIASFQGKLIMQPAGAASDVVIVSRRFWASPIPNENGDSRKKLKPKDRSCRHAVVVVAAAAR